MANPLLAGAIAVLFDEYHNAACISKQDADMIVVYSEGTRRFELEQNKP